MMNSKHLEAKGVKNMENIQEEWLPMRDVADMLKISYYKLSRLVAQNQISSQDDVLDRRVKLVEVNEVKRVFRLR